MGCRGVSDGCLLVLKGVGKSVLSRDELVEAVGRVIEVGLFRLDNKYTKNLERIKWARVVTQAVGVASEVLRELELEEVKRRIEALEALRVG